MLEIRVTQRFYKAYKKNLSLQFLVDGEARQFHRRYVASAAKCLTSYERVEAIDGDPIIEFDLGGSHRMIGHWRPRCLALLDVGGKAVVPNARNIDIARGIQGAMAAPQQFLASATDSIFHRAPAKGFQEFGGELHPEWIFDVDCEFSIRCHPVSLNSVTL